MEDVELSLSALTNISFDQLFGADQNSISLERVEAFLQKAVTIASGKAQSNPNELVRIAHNGAICWMTQKQATEYMKGEHDLRQDIERALRGELKYLRQELEILLALAHYTLGQYKKENTISPQDAQRIEPTLIRRQSEIKAGITDTRESELLLNEKRSRVPMLSEYEELMGEFLNEKAAGNMARAGALARELAKNKKRYILLSRALEPDVRTIYYHRLGLQKTKKRILSTQNEICSSRRDSLALEISSIENNLKEIKEKLIEAEKEGKDLAKEEIYRMQIYDLKTKKEEIDKKSTELGALDQETQILERQEREVQSVISTISETVLQEVDMKDDIKESVKKSQRPKIQESTPNVPEKESRSQGMHFGKHRR